MQVPVSSNNTLYRTIKLMGSPELIIYWYINILVILNFKPTKKYPT